MRVVTTGAAPADLLTRIRRLLDEAFDDGFGEQDWEHTLGGQHVLVDEAAGDVVAHAAVVPRTLTIGGRTFRSGYVEGVATAPGRHGEGLGSLAMSRLGDVLRARFEIGALSTGRHSFYARLGWERWRGPTFVRDGHDLIRSEDADDGVMVLRFGPSAGVDLTDAIACEARSGDDW